MYKPSRIYFRRQEACDSLALDFATMESSSSQEEEATKEQMRVEQSKEQGSWRQELRDRQSRTSAGDNDASQSQRQF